MDPSIDPMCIICVNEENARPKPGIHPCFGCKKGFCTSHVLIHRQVLCQDLELIVNERNELYDRVFHNPDSSKNYLIDALNGVDRWRQQAHDRIDETAEHIRQNLLAEFDEKLQEIRQRGDKLTGDLNEKLEADSYFENDIEQCRSELNAIKLDIDQIKVTPHFPQWRIVDESIDDDHLSNPKLFRRTKSLSLSRSDLNSQRNSSARQTIRLDNRRCSYMVASEEYLLAWIVTHDMQQGRLVLYRIFDATELNSTPLELPQYKICDMAYAKSLNQCFLIVCYQKFFIYDPTTGSLVPIKKVQSIEGEQFSSIAVSSNTNDVFISIGYNQMIEHWSTQHHPQWNPIKRRKTKEILTETDEGIRMIRICENRHQMACSVLQSDLSWRIDLFDFDFQLIRRGIRIPINTTSQQAKFVSRLTIVTIEDKIVWLFTHVTSNTLWFVDDSHVRLIGNDICTIDQINNDTEEKKLLISFCDKPRSIEIFNLLL